MTKRIYVGNLSSHTTERELAGLFERVGQVVSVRIMVDRSTGRSRGFGFVEMNSEEAERAITQLHQMELNGHALSVSEARTRPESSADRGGLSAVRLFVGNLPYDATTAEVKEYFSSVGPVSAVSLPVERESGRPRGFAFVEFPEQVHAQDAVRRFHNQPFKGRTLVVNEARARESGPAATVASRPSQPLMEYPTAAPFTERLEERPSRRGGLGHQFGRDAVPQRHRKQPGRSPKSERGRRKPIPERKGGQFFGAVDDDPYDDTFTGDPFTSQMYDPESDE